MKGIPTDVLIKHCEQINITPRILYEKLYYEESFTFELCIGLKQCFIKNQDGTITTAKDLTRTLQFVN